MRSGSGMAGETFPFPGRSAHACRYLRALLCDLEDYRLGVSARSSPGLDRSAMIGGYRAALTSINNSGVTLQTPGEEAFQVAPSA